MGLPVPLRQAEGAAAPPPHHAPMLRVNYGKLDSVSPMGKLGQGLSGSAAVPADTAAASANKSSGPGGRRPSSRLDSTIARLRGSLLGQGAAEAGGSPTAPGLHTAAHSPHPSPPERKVPGFYFRRIVGSYGTDTRSNVVNTDSRKMESGNKLLRYCR